MRCLRRNKVPYWYAVYVRSETAYDDYGNESGKNVVYSHPVEGRINASPAKDVSTVAVFGTDVNYDKVLAADNIAFDENAMLWLDTPPVLNSDGSTDTPPDYVVKRIARSLNSVLVAVSRVNVRYG